MSLFRTKRIDLMISSAAAGKSSLDKSLGPVDLTLLGVGAIIGTGIFVLTGTGALMAGPALMLSFLVAAIACALTALAYAEFSSSIPVAGSIYSYAYAVLGELIAWLTGWILILEYGLAVSAVSVGWSGYFQSLISGFGLFLPPALRAAPGALPGVQTWFNLPAFVIVMFITWLLAIGIRKTARLNNVMVVIKIGVIGLILAVGAFHVKPANWHPFMPMGWSGVFNASAIMFFAYIGFDAVSSAAEEVKNPKRDLPVGLICSLLICTILYVGVTAVLTGMTPWQQFAGVAHPVSLSFQQAGKNWVAGFIDLGAVLGMMTVILVMGYGQTRLVFAMSRDGLLPPSLSRVHPRYRTPWRATWISGAIFGLVGALVPLGVLAELVNFGTLTAFAMVSVAVIVLRRTHPELPRGFVCPGMPVVPALAIAACLFLLVHLQAVTWIAFGIWVSIGTAIYFGWSRRHAVLGQCPPPL